MCRALCRALSIAPGTVLLCSWLSAAAGFAPIVLKCFERGFMRSKSHARARPERNEVR